MFTKEFFLYSFHLLWGFVSLYFAYLAVKEWRQQRRQHRQEIIICKILAGRFAEAKALLQKIGYPEEICEVLIQQVYIRHEDSLERALEYYPAFEVLRKHLKAFEAGELPEGLCLLPSVEHPEKAERSLALLMTAQGLIAKRDCKKRQEHQKILNDMGELCLENSGGLTLEVAKKFKAAVLAFSTGLEVYIYICGDDEDSVRNNPEEQYYTVVVSFPYFELSSG
jgi:hypothetical protein